MDIVKKEGFRSSDIGVNQCDNMYRVTIHMTHQEFALFTQYKLRQENKENINFSEVIGKLNGIKAITNELIKLLNNK